MKKLDYYQCDFCSENGEKGYIEKHEKDCNKDPKKKRCESCSHFNTYMDHGLYFTEECRKGVNCDEMSDIRYGEIICAKWSAI